MRNDPRISSNARDRPSKMAAGFSPLYLPLVDFSLFCCHGDQKRWLTNQIPFVAASGPNITLDNPSELDVFFNSLGDDLWDRVVQESNRYTQQKLGNRFASFHQITRAELKAFIGINLIMGINRLQNYALFWSNDDFFGNQGIKRVMTKNRFEEISQYLHFNDSTKEPARCAANFDRLFKVRTVIDC